MRLIARIGDRIVGALAPKAAGSAMCFSVTSTCRPCSGNRQYCCHADGCIEHCWWQQC